MWLDQPPDVSAVSKLDTLSGRGKHSAEAADIVYPIDVFLMA